MSRYTAVNLDQLTFPAIIEKLEYETILAEMKADAVRMAPILEDALSVEGDPAQAILQAIAYRALVHEARQNDVARAAYLATASGTDLDNLVAEYGVSRFVIAPADPDAVPPVPAVMETDAELRYRAQIALEAFSTAGPRGAYEYHALSADARVLNVGVSSPSPGQVRVVVLARDGVPSAEILNNVAAMLNAEEIRPLCDTVNVVAAAKANYAVTAVLTMRSGPGSEAALADAREAVRLYTDEQRRVGATVYRSALFAALHRPGVESVNLISPATDIVATALQAPWASAITITAA